jgi:D-sedoheptulose 7-phosphate isomerase
MLEAKVTAYNQELQQCFAEIDPKKLEKVVMHLLRRGQTIFILGNGGSASTASHMEVDLTKGSYHERGFHLRVMSLTNNMAVVTAVANDISYEAIFTEQLKIHMKSGDVVIGITASGNSPNVLSAMKYAKEHGAVTIGFIGFGGGKLKDLVDIDLTVSSRNYGVVEDFHSSLNHIISQFIKQFFEGGERWTS